MSSLFIIGNGFDISHSLKTKYTDFKEYLENQFANYQMETPSIPGTVTDKDGSRINDSVYEVKRFITNFLNYNLCCSSGADINNNWNNLESKLSELDYNELFDGFHYIFVLDNYENPFEYGNIMEDYAKDISVPLCHLNDLCHEWIKTIDVNTVTIKEDFSELIGEGDIFLSFNYTKTLETCYDIPNNRICHIHGVVGTDIVLGHGQNSFDDKYVGASNFAAVDQVSDAHAALFKDTKKYFEDNKWFFDMIDNRIDKVYSYGFSFSDVDMFYITEIFKRTSRDAVWYFNSYDNERMSEFSQQLKNNKIFAKYDTYNIKN